MQENKLSPFDMDLCVMIESVTKKQTTIDYIENKLIIKVCVFDLEKKEVDSLVEAVKSRLKERFVSFMVAEGLLFLGFKEDPELKDYPNQYFYETKEFQKVPGSTYCRKLKEIEAVLFVEKNIDEIVAFTGGGTLTVPKLSTKLFDDIAYYEFVTPNGIFCKVFAGEYIVNDNGRFYKMNKKAFDSDFEPKN